MALAWMLAVVGLFFGAVALESLSGGVIGAAVGFVLGWVMLLAERTRALESKVRELERKLTKPPAATPAPAAARVAEPAPAAPEVIRVHAPAQPRESEWIAPQPAPDKPKPVEEKPAARQAPVEAPSGWAEADVAGVDPFKFVRRFFTDGNLVVRVGIIVLFFGVAFLLKYAIEQQLLPIELRLAATALGAIGLIGLGWRLRERRSGYALLIQGGGIGIFYLTVFAAAKLYQLLPLGLALLLMVAVVALSSVLALWQNSRALAAFGIAGGFLAPVLTSSGGGSHVMLFSYYALLNAGILGLAWFRAWRELNLLGFLFTYVIGAAWGLNYYQPQHFNTTEPFLILFFLFYVAIAVLFALRQPLALRGYVDGTLVFGVPVVGFALQAGLVHDFEYGLAISAFALGGFYITLAAVLWRREREGMRLLTESFLALGVVFATLAIPLATSGRWTSAAWALEGAALLWIGIHQRRLLPRIAGLLLQVGAGLFFVLELHRPAGDWPLLNGIFLGAMLISAAGVFSAFQIYRHRDHVRDFERGFEPVMLAWGLLWWLVFGVREIGHHLPRAEEFNSTLLFVVASAAALLLAWRSLAWPMLRYPPLALLPAAIVMSLEIVFDRHAHFFARWGIVPWALLFAVQYRLLWRMEGVFGERLLRWGHAITLWFLLALLGYELWWTAEQLLALAPSWQAVACVIPAVLAMVALGGRRWVPGWPVARFDTLYQIEALLPPALALLLWGLLTLRLDGDPAPLPFVPLLNPLELMQALVLIVVISWWWTMRNEERLLAWMPERRMIVGLFALLAFVWLNGVIAHAVHHWAQVPYTLTALHRSVLFQTALSVTWTVVALVVTVSATRLRLRTLWMAGGLLLGLVVLKLFFIDLAKSGTVERIVSFMAVGGLMLVIGYFSPLPPKQTEVQPR
ncbi:MAG: DUF2339 domain-containing protein [Pseudomonadota bacterium]